MPGATEIIKLKRPRFRVAFPILKLWCFFYEISFALDLSTHLSVNLTLMNQILKYKSPDTFFVSIISNNAE